MALDEQRQVSFDCDTGLTLRFLALPLILDLKLLCNDLRLLHCFRLDVDLVLRIGIDVLEAIVLQGVRWHNTSHLFIRLVEVVVSRPSLGLLYLLFKSFVALLFWIGLSIDRSLEAVG